MSIKYSIIALILTSSLFSGCSNSSEANTTVKLNKSTSIKNPSIDTEIIDFTKKQISKNRRVTLKDISKTIPWISFHGAFPIISLLVYFREIHSKVYLRRRYQCVYNLSSAPQRPSQKTRYLSPGLTLRAKLG